MYSMYVWVIVPLIMVIKAAAQTPDLSGFLK